MSEAEKYIEMMIDADVEKIVISNPASKQSEYKKITAEKKAGYFHVVSGKLFSIIRGK